VVAERSRDGRTSVPGVGGPHQIVCRRCRGVYSPAFFRRLDGSGDQPAIQTCIGCERHRRLVNHEEVAVRRKARSTLRHHADRYQQKGTVGSLDDFVVRFGWDVDRMIVDIRAALSHPCHYCATPLVALAECSLDITDPHQAPHYRSNTRWICRWCNREKARSGITRWEDKLNDWGRWKQRHSELLSGMPLFEWADSHENLTLFD